MLTPFRLLLLSFALCLFSCQATKTSKATSNSTEVTQSDQNGSSKEQAIVVKSIDAEYQWIKKNYPGSRVTSQALIHSGKKSYDLLTFTTSEGETKQAYFDITSFFGKF
jgi:outer membrane protein assembly factor BamD (BamD/ComL family)